MEEKKETALEVPVQEQLSRKITEKLNTNLPLYLKNLDVKEGSITHDVVVTVIGVFLQVLKELNPEIPIQEQYVGKCSYCNKTNEIQVPVSKKPNFCMECGKPIIYQKSHYL